MRGGALVLAASLLAATAAQARPLRVLSLDQCADQYVLAIAPDADLFLSPRADDPDSRLAWAALAYPQVRPTLETAVGVRPDVVVRTWGGEPRLLAALARRGARIVDVPDATEMAEIRTNIRSVAAALDRDAAGARIVARMDARLAQAAHPPAPGRTALYLTSGGFTAGQGTLIDSILRAAGFANLAGLTGFGAVSVERIALEPPRRFLLGFFDQVRADWRGVGRHPVIQTATRGRVAAALPASVLTCPAWFAADAAVMLSRGQGAS
ncbi:iron ABC transporter substrate-binding protein [Brevundimonas sp. LM2]|uniref:ABC transporter substrate-binding protein n=1 Tax=Brevundimonas sp. LM2 TaxID=1938605 RepID=UPI0009840891|nr:ABC transporter substrate-binding protein [Brevundimonas sp. LM2]AQR62177.1 iron ABC transporter substrate-binding protein [Brevundimonas sp. LM2]